jgi:hypothetical protein
MNEWAAYLPFCQSERQAQVISLRAQGMTAEKAAEVMGINKRNAIAMCSRVKAVAAKQGYSPEHDMVHTVPDNFSVSGTSTFTKTASPSCSGLNLKTMPLLCLSRLWRASKRG